MRAQKFLPKRIISRNTAPPVPFLAPIRSATAGRALTRRPFADRLKMRKEWPLSPTNKRKHGKTLFKPNQDVLCLRDPKQTFDQRASDVSKRFFMGTVDEKHSVDTWHKHAGGAAIYRVMDRASSKVVTVYEDDMRTAEGQYDLIKAIQQDDYDGVDKLLTEEPTDPALLPDARDSELVLAAAFCEIKPKILGLLLHYGADPTCNSPSRR
eukprot:COSAG04_NODE_2261_length_4426_cov_1.913335_7_plen_210_part_00